MNISLKKMLYLVALIGLVSPSVCKAWGRYGGGWGWGGGWRHSWGWGGPSVYVESPYYHDGSAVVAGIGGVALGAALASSNRPRTAAEEADFAEAEKIRAEAREDRMRRKREREEDAADRREQRRKDDAERKAQRRKEKDDAEEARRAKKLKRLETEE